MRGIVAPESTVKEDEGLDNSEDKEEILRPRVSVALSSLSILSLDGAEKDCLRKGDS